MGLLPAAHPGAIESEGGGERKPYPALAGLAGAYISASCAHSRGSVSAPRSARTVLVWVVVVWKEVRREVRRLRWCAFLGGRWGL